MRFLKRQRYLGDQPGKSKDELYPFDLDRLAAMAAEYRSRDPFGTGSCFVPVPYWELETLIARARQYNAG